MRANLVRANMAIRFPVRGSATRRIKLSGRPEAEHGTCFILMML